MLFGITHIIFIECIHTNSYWAKAHIEVKMLVLWNTLKLRDMYQKDVFEILWKDIWYNRLLIGKRDRTAFILIHSFFFYHWLSFVQHLVGAGAPTVFERRWAPPQNSWVKVCINVHLLGYNVLLRVQWPFVTLFQAYEEDVPQKCSGGKYSGKLFSLTLTVSVSLCWTLTYICFQRSKLVKYFFVCFLCF